MTQIVLNAVVYFLLFTLTSVIIEGVTLNVVDFGAKPDGETDSTNALLSAWGRACSSTSPTTIFVPLGRFLVGKVVFKGRCNNKGITIHIDGALVAPSKYDVIGNAENWLFFDDVDGVSVIGGVLDGQGTDLWACKRSAKSCPIGATNMGFTNSNNIVINGVTSLNSQMFHIVIDRCDSVKIQGVKIFAAGNSPNTDGIHVQLSSSVNILNSNIATGDDCISIGPGTTNLWIQNIACGPGHGISVGSLGKEFQEAGVQNVTVKTVTFTGTENGVRIKSWGRPSNGYARKILFQHVTMVNVQNPIVIDQNYCPNEKNCPSQVSGVEISNVIYQDIHGTSTTAIAVKMNCSPKNPCTGIRLEDVMLTYESKQVVASCNHAGGITSGVVQPNNCF
ncbi:polygalacturonase [Cajanus cajan]|uniref:Polygalacturonase n=1 Tax=Cajanus cajan TaxID=3821 RepID=A0A151QYB3_CAJCA|nr:polygalacturonase [Cajanus cajan]KYP35266.1 Polygalacturonase [Cajanus cajan]